MLSCTELADHLIYVVDDDARIREALLNLLRSNRMNAIAFSTAGEYLAHKRSGLPGCLILDVELPDINGLDLQKRLAVDDHPPIVFLTGHADVPLSVRAVKAGAVDFLAKPFSKTALLAAIQEAVEQDRAAQTGREETAKLRRSLVSLTPREREVFPLVIGGLLNKQAAAELGISEVTLQIHRSRIMQKMQADSVADLVRMAAKLGVEPCRRPGARPRA